MRRMITNLLNGKFLRFLLVGGISAVIEYSLYFAFKVLFSYLVANFMAFAFTNVVTFLLSKKYVFSSSGSRKTEEAALFAICLAGAYAMNHAVLWCLVEYASVDDRYAKAAAIGVAVVWNFFTRKHIVFRHRGQTVPARARAKDFPEDNS